MLSLPVLILLLSHGGSSCGSDSACMWNFDSVTLNFDLLLASAVLSVGCLCVQGCARVPVE